MIGACATRITVNLQQDQDTFIICDAAHRPLATGIAQKLSANVRVMEITDKASTDRAFSHCRTHPKQTLLLIEPQVFSRTDIGRWLDFSKGTALYFTSRTWLDTDHEVLTAPLEQSIEGVVVVDGALFLQALDTPLTLYIQKGVLTKIEASDRKGQGLVERYQNMTQGPFTLHKNRQVAEIGLGCSTGAIISHCFMESEMVHGTCHICFGNNFCYGGGKCQ